MKRVNLLVGTSGGATFKSEQYAAGIRNAGWEPVLNDPTADKHIACNEFRHREWVALTNEEGAFRYAGDKLANGMFIRPLTGYAYPWSTVYLGHVMINKKPFFVKQRYGSGATRSHFWSYTKHNSYDEFVAFLKNGGGLEHFIHYQTEDHATRALGAYVFQEWIEPTPLIGYDHFFNDGNGTKHWMSSPMDSKDEENHNLVATLMYEDSPLELPPGTFASLQYYERDGVKWVFDINTRSAGNWDFVYPHVAPDFYNVFFNNWLNGANDRYEYKPGYSYHKDIPSDIFLDTDQKGIAYMKGGRYLHVHQ